MEGRKEEREKERERESGSGSGSGRDDDEALFRPKPGHCESFKLVDSEVQALCESAGADSAKQLRIFRATAPRLAL